MYTYDITIFLSLSLLISFFSLLFFSLFSNLIFILNFEHSVPDSELKSRPDTKDFGLKQIEGTGLSMSACREIAVSFFICVSVSKIMKNLVFRLQFLFLNGNL